MSIEIKIKQNGWTVTDSNHIEHVYLDFVKMLEHVASSASLKIEDFPVGTRIEIIKKEQQ